MNIEEIKERYNRFDFVHSYVDDNGCDDEWKDAHVPIGYLLSIIEQAEKDLEQTKHYLEAEAYTNAWKETIKALKSIQGDE